MVKPIVVHPFHGVTATIRNERPNEPNNLDESAETCVSEKSKFKGLYSKFI